MELKKTKITTYNSFLIKKFINNLSKKTKSQKIEKSFFISLQQIKFKIQLNPVILFFFLLNEIKPCLILKSLRLGSSIYKIPVPLVLRKQLFKAIKLLVCEINTSKYKGPITFKIIHEFSLILSEKHFLKSISKTFYKTASNSRSFIHYR